MEVTLVFATDCPLDRGSAGFAYGRLPRLELLHGAAVGPILAQGLQAQGMKHLVA
jgi:hypothetical protein